MFQIAMKVTFFSFLFLTASFTAIRGQTPADSGKWPWNVPFTVFASASFQEQVEYDTGSNNGSSSTRYTGFDAQSINITVDSGYSRSFSGYTLTFDSSGFYDNTTYGYSVAITFDSGYDSIVSLTFGYYNNEDAGVSSNEGAELTLYGLYFDSVSIIYPDSTLSNSTFNYYYDVGGLYGQLRISKQLTSENVNSITLGGIFRPITLSAPASVSQPVRNSAQQLQSYPNPFSQSTTISFTPETSGYADVSIVNLLGSEVSHLFSGELAAGEHSFMWSNPTGLPMGRMNASSE